MRIWGPPVVGEGSNEQILLIWLTAPWGSLPTAAGCDTGASGLRPKQPGTWERIQYPGIPAPGD